jgi:hypothetical protein
MPHFSFCLVPQPRGKCVLSWYYKAAKVTALTKLQSCIALWLQTSKEEFDAVDVSEIDTRLTS